jgi:RNA-binding protein YlmH
VDRDRVGDILVQGEAGAQILVDPELVEHFEASLTQVTFVMAWLLVVKLTVSPV